ncbi:MAG TPA: PRC-barrel domain containing protein [Methanosarcinales archaeon]|nr:PRC-barrel domain containing protein [Methanosarcinales archaeon]
MTKVFAKSLLSKKRIMSVDGTELGILKSIVFDIRTGNLIDIIMKPDIELNTANYRTQGNDVLIPFESVRSVKDHIMVDKEIAMNIKKDVEDVE